MVYRDLNEDSQASLNTQARYYAAPFARFFSGLLDYFIFFPIIAFFMTFFFKDSVTMITQAVSDRQINSVFIQLFSFYILFYTLLQTCFIYFYSATPGQSYLKLYVHFEERSSNLFFQIWFRQIGFVLSLLFLGLPFLAVFYHKKHRTFYDRLSESDVLTFAPTEIFPLQEIDKKYLSAGVSVSLAFFCMVSFVSLIQSHQFSVNQLRTVSMLTSPAKKCFQAENQNPQERLKTALALNILNIIPDDCVIDEADQIFSQLGPSMNAELNAQAYFSKYYIEQKDKKSLEISSAYWAKACGTDIKSDLCAPISRETASDKSSSKLDELKLLKQIMNSFKKGSP